MTDRSGFERRFEARLQAHADRAAQRPFDAAAVTHAAALAGGTRRSLRWRGWPGASDAPASTLRVAIVGLLLLVGLAAGIVFVGAALQNRAPLPDPRAVVVAPTPVATPVPTPTRASLPPAGRALVTADGDIYLADPDGADPVKIADGDPYVDLADNLGSWVWANWSATGNYLSADLGESSVILRPDGTEVSRTSRGNVIWSPVGDRYLVVGNDAIEVHEVGSDLAWAAPLPQKTMLFSDPGWSPDGKRLAVEVCEPCVSADDRGPTDLWIFDIAASTHTVLTQSPDLMEEYPVWSPDGTRIAFWRSQPCIDGVCRYDIFVVAVDGGDPVQLSSDGVSVMPIWSPDSRHLAFHHGTGTPDTSPNGPSGYHIQTIELDGVGIAAGTSPVDVTPPSADKSDYAFGWSQDGSRIAFTRSPIVPQDQPQPDPAIWTVAADGTDPRQVVPSGPATWWDWPPLP